MSVDILFYIILPWQEYVILKIYGLKLQKTADSFGKNEIPISLKNGSQKNRFDYFSYTKEKMLTKDEKLALTFNRFLDKVITN